MNPRLSLALQGDDALPVTGRVLVLNAGPGVNLSALPKDRVTIVQGFRPDHDALVAQGFSVLASIGSGDFSAAVIFLPRAKAAARGLVADAVRLVQPGGPIWIDGQKTDGIETMIKDVRARVPISAPMSKAHGKIFRFDAPDGEVFADWAAAELSPAPGYVTLPGVFSADKVDRGSALLASALPVDLSGRIADLGAGWGWLSTQILAQDKVKELHLIEADHTALACARRNVADARAVFHWADATRFKPAEKFDFVITNPPFHTSRAADPALGADFIRAAAKVLKPSGVLILVANRHLPYETVLAEMFRDVSEVTKDAGFKVLRASHPQASPKAIPISRRRR